MSNVILGAPIQSDRSGVALSGGSWVAGLPLANLVDRRLALVARSSAVTQASTRFLVDLAAARRVGVIALPKHTLSSRSQYRIRGYTDAALFDYTPGDSIAGKGGTFTRATVASRVHSDGTIKNVTSTTIRDDHYVKINWMSDSEDMTTAKWSSGLSRAAVSGGTYAGYAMTKVYIDTVSSTNIGQTAQPITKAGTHVISFVVKADGTNAGLFRGGLFDAAAGTYRASWVITISAAAVVTATAAIGTLLGVTLLADSCYRVSILTTSLTAGNAVTCYPVNNNLGLATVTSALMGAWQLEYGNIFTEYYATNAANNYFGGKRSLLYEKTSTNLCLQSSNFGTTWTASGTPTRGAANITVGDIVLDLIGDAQAAAVSQYAQTVTFTGDAVKAVSLVFAQGTSTSSAILLRDTTASANRLLGVITWSGAVPTITMTTGTLLGIELLGVVSTKSIFRALFATTSVTAANTNQIQVQPASNAAALVTLQGDINLGGVQAENKIHPTSLLPTTVATVTRNADALTFTFSAVPQALTARLDFRKQSLADSTAPRLLIGGASLASNTVELVEDGTTNGVYSAGDYNGTEHLSTATSATVAVLGDRVELEGQWTALGVGTGRVTINGGTEAVGSASAGWSYTPATWNATTISFSTLPMALFRFTVAAGTQSNATMRLNSDGYTGNVFDSGWTDVWPQVFPTGAIPTNDPRALLGKYASDDLVDGCMSVCYLPTPVQCRYLVVELDDTTNSAGYVDVARLIVADAYQPTINMSEDRPRLGLETDTPRLITDGGAALYNDKPRRRTLAFRLNQGAESEVLAGAFDIMRRIGTSGQLYVVYDPADTYHLHRRAFLGVFRQLSALEHAFARYGVAWEIVEEL